MNGKSIAVAIGVLVLAGGGYLLLQKSKDAQPQASTSPEVTPTMSVSLSPTASGSAGVSVKTFAVIGEPFSFDPKEMRVNKGDTVKIVFTNIEGVHDWGVDEFSARTSKTLAGKTTEVTFVADKTGSFQYYCAVGNHRAQGMWGTLVVQ